MKTEKCAIMEELNRERHEMVSRRDVSYKEWNNLVALYRHESASLSRDTEGRLRQLGLTDENGITEVGKQLVEHELLMERRTRLQD